MSRAEGGIRTHVPKRTNGFQDRRSTTALLPLQTGSAARTNPRTPSTHDRRARASDGNRTRAACLGSRSTAVILRRQNYSVHITIHTHQPFIQLTAISKGHYTTVQISLNAGELPPRFLPDGTSPLNTHGSGTRTFHASFRICCMRTFYPPKLRLCATLANRQVILRSQVSPIRPHSGPACLVFPFVSISTTCIGVRTGYDG